MSISAADLAEVYAALGQKDAAMRWLQKAYEERLPQMVFLKMEPTVIRSMSTERKQHTADCSRGGREGSDIRAVRSPRSTLR
jgi:hypothetical protein